MKAIDYYNEWMKTGKMNGVGNGGGLCNCLPKKYYKTLVLFRPEPLGTEISGEEDEVWWASELPSEGYLTDKRLYGFNPLRQTILLFIAAIHNEL